MIGNFEFKVIFIPGHTSGHVAYYFEKEKIIFTGDTLFSLGCGRVFEGTHKEMFDSLEKLKKINHNTKIYCGHEYTKKNLDFCLKYDKENIFLKKKVSLINSYLINKQPTVPTTLSEEMKTNIFLRCNDKALKQELDCKDLSDYEIFSKLRELKDSF